MKIIMWFLLLIGMSAHASNYYEPYIDTYDPISGLYYKAVEENTEGGGFLSSKMASNAVVNINIFDPASGSSTLLFREPQREGITIVLFETGLKDGAVEFSGRSAPSLVLNNTRVEKRAPKDKLLVGVRSKDAKETILFVSDKRGGNLKKLVAVPAAASWHIDARNSRLRVVHQTGNGVRIESLEW